MQPIRKASANSKPGVIQPCQVSSEKNTIALDDAMMSMTERVRGPAQR